MAPLPLIESLTPAALTGCASYTRPLVKAEREKGTAGKAAQSGVSEEEEKNVDVAPPSTTIKADGCWKEVRGPRSRD
jgi:hypothetical protein